MSRCYLLLIHHIKLNSALRVKIQRIGLKLDSLAPQNDFNSIRRHLRCASCLPRSAQYNRPFVTTLNDWPTHSFTSLVNSRPTCSVVLTPAWVQFTADNGTCHVQLLKTSRRWQIVSICGLPSCHTRGHTHQSGQQVATNRTSKHWMKYLSTYLASHQAFPHTALQGQAICSGQSHIPGDIDILLGGTLCHKLYRMSPTLLESTCLALLKLFFCFILMSRAPCSPLA